MAQKLSEAERRRLATDFDPPAVPQAYAASLTGGKAARVTATLPPVQYAMLREIAERRGWSMSRAIGEAVAAFYEKNRRR